MRYQRYKHPAGNSVYRGTTVDRISVTRIAPMQRPEIRRLDGIDKDDFDFVEHVSAIGSIFFLLSTLTFFPRGEIKLE